MEFGILHLRYPLHVPTIYSTTATMTTTGRDNRVAVSWTTTTTIATLAMTIKMSFLGAFFLSILLY